MRRRVLGVAILVLTACSSATTNSAEYLRCQLVTEWETAAGSLPTLVDMPLDGTTDEVHVLGAEGIEARVKFDGESLSLAVQSTDSDGQSGLLSVRYDNVADEAGPLGDVGTQVYDSGPRLHPTRQLSFEISCVTR